jgi:hypothetical protein
VPGLSDVLGVRDPGPRGWSLVIAAGVITLVIGQLARALMRWRWAIRDRRN